MTTGLAQVVILGTGTSTGVPVPTCSCPVCSSPLQQNKRTRCSALLSWGGRNILIDTATDLRQQVLREQVSRIDAVLFTHTHADHVHGIDDLRPFNRPGQGAIPLYGAAADLAVLRTTFPYIFSAQAGDGYRPRLTLREISTPFELFGMTVQPIPLWHGPAATLGYRVGPFAYLTDCSEIPEESALLLQGLEVLVIDALRFTPHNTHFNVAQALREVERLRPRRALLTHLSHEIDHDRHSHLLPSGVGFAYDGQRLSFAMDTIEQS
jgi:phosphoribosyl 1,2-cyclic phosphate phosphodiesterase